MHTQQTNLIQQTVEDIKYTINDVEKHLPYAIKLPADYHVAVPEHIEDDLLKVQKYLHRINDTLCVLKAVEEGF